MRAMVLAAGLGTRLRPITYEIAKPMVPVLDRPVMAHIVDLLERHGVEQIVANLHYFPDADPRLLRRPHHLPLRAGAARDAGGVRNCADLLGEETFLVISGDALTDIDLDALLAAPPRARRDRDARREARRRHPRVRRRRARRARADHAASRRSRAGWTRAPTSATAASTASSRRSSTTFPPPVRRLGAGRVPGPARRTTLPFYVHGSRSTGTTSARSPSCARAPSTRSPASCRIEVPAASWPGVIVGEGSSDRRRRVARRADLDRPRRRDRRGRAPVRARS
jgi:hypothetical protein